MTSWEMSTIGHPLSDLVNLLSPFTIAESQVAFQIGYGSKEFWPCATPGLPTKRNCIEWYRDIAGWDPSPDIAWGEAFGLLRNAIIMQGIAARFALRQASSAKAIEYASQVKPFSEIGWSFVERCKRQNDSKL